MAMNRAVFLDKDGTLVPDIPYNANPALMELSQGAGEALRALAAAGYLLVVVSNQSGVARGKFPEAALDGVSAKLEELCAAEGVRLAGVYYCVHHPEAEVAAYRTPCDCRKPAAGLLHRAADDLGVALEESWMIGDILNDIEAGRKCGTRTILLDSGNETEWVLSTSRLPHHTAADLREAASIILAVDRLRIAERQAVMA